MNTSRLRSVLAAIAVTAAGLASSAVQAAYVLTEVARPGAASTALWDINNSGVMVGYSNSGTTDFSSAFVFDGTTYTALTGPAGALSSAALGISDGGTVVGSYNTSSSVDGSGNPVLDGAQGFIYQGGSYTTLAVAGALDTFLRGISPDGRYLSGYYNTAAQTSVGFVYDTLMGTLTTVSQPNSVQTFLQGINSQGLVAGSDILTGTPGTRPGLLYDIGTGTLTELSIAGAFRTALRAIADDGVLAGWFRDGTGQHGFVGSVSSYEQIDFVGATDTFVEGSNNAGVLVGEYFNADGSVHGFIATPVSGPGSFALLALGLGALAYTRARRRGDRA